MDWPYAWRHLRRPDSLGLLLIVMAGIPVNWLLETRKWQLLLRPFHRWPFRRCLAAVLAGLSVGIATPNRLGEVGGRLLAGAPHERAGILISTLLGGLTQWCAFLGLGWPALLYVARPWLPPSLADWWVPAALIGPLLIIGTLISGTRPLLTWSEHQLAKRQLLHQNTLTALRDVKLRLIRGAAAYSLARFGVYCTQFWLLLRVFGLELDWLGGLTGVAAIYTAQAGLPLPPGLNLAARAELGLLLWADQPAAGPAVLLAAVGLFFLNVLLPSLLGFFTLTSPPANHEL